MFMRLGAALAVAGAAGIAAAAGSGWSGPETVAPVTPSAVLQSPRVVVDGRGAATAVWTVRTASATSGAEARRPAGGAWGSPSPLPGAPAAFAGNARGDQLLAWLEPRPDGPASLAVSYRPASGSWRPRLLVSAEGDSVFYPDVALDARGGALVVWSVGLGRGNEYRIDAAVRRPGGRWVQRRTVATGTGAAQVAMNQGGDASVVWLQSCASVAPADDCGAGGPGSAVVRIATRSAGGVWRAAHTLSAPGEDATVPQVVVNPSGTTIALWQTFALRPQAAPARGLSYAIGSARGRFGRPTQLFAGFPDGPAGLALAPTGDAVAVWAAFDEIYAATRRPYGTFATPAQIGSGFAPGVDLDARGNAIALWTRSADLKLSIHAATRAPGGVFDAGVDVAPAGADCTRHRTCNPGASLAVGRNGTGVAVWQMDTSQAEQFGDSFVQAAQSDAPLHR